MLLLMLVPITPPVGAEPVLGTLLLVFEETPEARLTLLLEDLPKLAAGSLAAPPWLSLAEVGDEASEDVEEEAEEEEEEEEEVKEEGEADESRIPKAPLVLAAG